MKYSAALLAAIVPFAAAWPTVMEMDTQVKRQANGQKTGRPNTGAGDYTPTFDAASQYVNVEPGSPNEWQAPTASDTRGQCPGLNAAANHNFLPRSGLPTIVETITGLGDAYNMSPDLAGFLAAVAVLLSGDIPSLTWSIGGAFPATVPELFTPDGILGTHDEYEGDASVTRGDAYLNNGNVNVFELERWNALYNQFTDGNLNLDDGANHSNYVTDLSVQNNPYYFSGPFSGLVAPAAMNFVVNFMSNHSAAVPGGLLDQSILKSFWSITGEPGSFVYTPGYERIPYNWYKRPGGAQQYNAVNVFQDLIAGAAIYPGTIRFGGNTGKVNTFTGVDPSDLTGGVFEGSTLFQGNNLACFAFRSAQAIGIQELRGEYNTLGSLLDPVLAPINALFEEFSCPQLAKYDYSVLEVFPGYNYSDRAVENE